MLKWKPDGTSRCGVLALRSGKLEQSGNCFAAASLHTGDIHIDLYWDRGDSVLAAQLNIEIWLRTNVLAMQKDLDRE